jgi:hypothetical protein
MLLYQLILLVLAVCTSARNHRFYPTEVASLTIPEGSPPPGDYCGPVTKLIGEGYRTRVNIQVCIRISATNNLILKLTDGEYFNGHEWSGASPQYPLHWRAGGFVEKVGSYDGSGDALRSSTQNSLRSLPNLESGEYGVTIQYEQTGPYWPHDLGTSQEFNIVLP